MCVYWCYSPSVRTSMIDLVSALILIMPFWRSEHEVQPDPSEELRLCEDLPDILA
jgi:hypothetical protein